MRLGLDQKLVFFLKLRRAHFLQIFDEAFEALFDLAEVADHQVEFDILDIAQRVDGADMRDRIVFKGAQHMNQRVHLTQVADVGGLLERFLADRADVDVFDGGVREFLGLVDGGQPVEPVVGNLGDADVRFARIGQGLGGKIRLGEHAEQGGLADLRESNDARFHESSLQPSALRDCAQTRAERYEQPFRINEEFDGDQMCRRSLGASQYVFR